MQSELVVASNLTVRISNIQGSAKQLLTFLESFLGEGRVYAIQMFTQHEGFVQFENSKAKTIAMSLFSQRKLILGGSYISLSHSLQDVVMRPVTILNRFEDGRVDVMELHAGVMMRNDCVGSLECWKEVRRVWFMPERSRIEFVVSSDDGGCFKLEVGFGDVVEANGCCLGDNKVNAILLKLKHAPKLYKKVAGPNIASILENGRYCKDDYEFCWVRTTNFSKVMSIGYMSCLCWVNKQGFLGGQFTSLPYYHQEALQLSMEEGVQFPTSDLAPMVPNDSGINIPFEVVFQLNSLVHAHKISLSAVDNNLLQVLGTLDMDTALTVLRKFHKLPSTCYEPVPFIRDQTSFIRREENTASATKRKIMTCHNVLITPSKIFCSSAEQEESNYIFENFGSSASNFMRVTFVDEIWERLSAHALSATGEKGVFANPNQTGICHRVLSVLQNGITIGGKKFEFLAASQLRSNAVWMFAPTDNVNTDCIREWMGEFKSIRSIMKCAARMDQLFISSTQTFEVLPYEMHTIDDIEVATGGVKYCFSDGIGKISFYCAKDISRKLGLSYIPSAFQIRYGGYKGVVAVDKYSVWKLELRRSMLKFEFDDCMINVIRCCDPLPGHLNREIITLLSTLGVEDNAFLELQAEQLIDLGEMLTNAESAMRVLESTGGSEMTSVVMNMLTQGYELTKEPYLLTILKSHFRNQLSDLKGRGRVFVPKARVLLGCLDETGTLEYGQVYVRLTMNKSELEYPEQVSFQRVDENTCVLKGKVVVTKNPCLHPGDIRVLEAVWDLKLLDDGDGPVNCLVFPQKGHGPHPNECSGGDLDGDQYFISWDESLIPPRTVAPMDGHRPRIMDHNVTVEEIQKFFVNNMTRDTLGAISTAHLVHADREPEKALSSKCLQLATLHSLAVDLAKTGAPVEMPRELKIREFPDFMECWEEPMYISKGPLGKLYRATIEFLRETTSNSDDYSSIEISEAYDHDLVVDGHEAFLEVAKCHKERYIDEIEALMRFYAAETEIEILTGDLQNKSGYLQWDNRRYGEVKDRILASVKSMIKDVKGWFETTCSGDDDEQKKLASAWYHVTYHSTFSKGSKNCLGFPWVVGDVLLDIKSDKMQEVTDSCSG